MKTDIKIRREKDALKGVRDMSKAVPDFEIPVEEAGPGPEQFQPVRRVRARKLLEKETAKVALKQAFVMLRPDLQWNNPVMFVVSGWGCSYPSVHCRSCMGWRLEPGVH